MSTTYLVSIEMETKGDLGAGKVNALKSNVIDLKGAVASVAEGFTGLVEKAGAFAMHEGMIGAVAGVGALTYATIGLNSELENTQISLAAIFGAQHITNNMHEGMEKAGVVMEQMRKDAAALPGEFDDLKNIFTTIATPALNTGMSVDAVRAMASQTMAVGAVMGIRSDQSAREMAMLLEGRAGGHNVLGMRLGFMGDKAHKLKTASEEDRVKMLNEELGKYAPAIDEFQKSWEGISTSATSTIKMLGAKATSPLFDSIKDTLSGINNWFDQNQLLTATWAEALGSKLQAAWLWGTKTVEEWGPLVLNFASVTYDRLVGVWNTIEPYAEKFAGWMKSALEDPNGTLDKIGHVLELYAAVKVGGALIGGMGGVSLGGMASTAGSALGWLGEAGMATVSLAGLGTAAGSAGMQLMAYGAAALPALGMVATLAAAGAAWYEVWDQGTQLHAEMVKDANADSIARAEAGFRVIDSMEHMDYANQDYQVSIMRAINASDELAVNMMWAAAAAKDFAQENKGHAGDQERWDSLVDNASDAIGKANTDAILKGAQKTDHKPSKHPGGGGVNIAKIEIQVTSNAEPSRVARLTAAEIAHLRRHGRSSPDVRNWSGARG